MNTSEKEKYSTTPQLDIQTLKPGDKITILTNYYGNCYGSLDDCYHEYTKYHTFIVIDPDKGEIQFTYNLKQRFYIDKIIKTGNLFCIYSSPDLEVRKMNVKATIIGIRKHDMNCI